MRYFIFLFPLFAICQSNSQSAGGFRFYDTNKSNITLYQTTGSRFYHEKFLTSIIKGKKVVSCIWKFYHRNQKMTDIVGVTMKV